MSAERVAEVPAAQQPTRRPRRPTIPSRTISIPYGDGLPEEVLKGLQGIEFNQVQRPDGKATFLVCATKEAAQKVFAAARAADLRPRYQNYTLYFRADQPPACSAAELQEQVVAALAPAQLTEFRAYSKQAGDAYVPRGDGHLSLDRYNDMIDLLERKQVEIGERTLSFHPYRPKPREAPRNTSQSAAAMPPASIEKVFVAMGEAMKAMLSVAAQSQSEAAATFDTEFA